MAAWLNMVINAWAISKIVLRPSLEGRLPGPCGSRTGGLSRSLVKSSRIFIAAPHDLIAPPGGLMEIRAGAIAFREGQLKIGGFR
jgi:hypothetical protein